MNELALFAGAGGGILGGHLLGWRTVCAVEWNAYAAIVLCARQNDGILAPFPIWDDVQTFDGKPWRGIVDVVSGGFPCQDISIAGSGGGIEAERSGMWKHMARIVGEVRPRFVFVENSPMLVTRGLGTVVGDLAAMGYGCRWGVVSAADVGAPHLRERIWIVGHSNNNGQAASQIGCRAFAGGDDYEKGADEASEPSGSNFQHGSVADANGYGEQQSQGVERQERGWPCDSGKEISHSDRDRLERIAITRVSQPAQRRVKQGSAPAGTPSEIGSGRGWWGAEPNVGRVANGVAARVDRLKAIRNGQVPFVASTAFELLAEGFGNE